MKKCFARSKLTAAIGTVLAAGAMSTPVQAVNHSDNGLGEVGLIPYYTVRNNIDTNLSVVNTSDRYVVAFKIRFREGANSRDARDFNVFLSPNDVWTATVSMGDDGETPFVQTADMSCTAPWTGPNPDQAFVVVGQTADGRDIKRMNLTNIDYNGGTLAGNDAGPDGIERAQEGHIEIIEMGVADPEFSDLADMTVHGPGQDCAFVSGVYPTINNTITVTGSGPLECHLDSPFVPGNTASGNEAFRAEFCEPLNVLKVSANLIRVDMGVAGGLPISTLANFANPALVEDPDAPNFEDIMEIPSATLPNMGTVVPRMSMQIVDGALVQETFAGSAVSEDAVSSLFSATDVINEFALGGAGLANTGWVVTFPTKYAYVDRPAPVQPPFQQVFGSGGSAVTVEYEYYDREERGPDSPPGGVLPSPIPEVPVETNAIHWESQVLNFSGDDNLFGSQHAYTVGLEEDFNSGWMRLGFPRAGVIVGDTGITFGGLPTIGFALKTLENGVVGDALLNYGVITPHAYYRDVMAP